MGMSAYIDREIRQLRRIGGEQRGEKRARKVCSLVRGARVGLVRDEREGRANQVGLGAVSGMRTRNTTEKRSEHVNEEEKRYA
jgi:hypothetical protein